MEARVNDILANQFLHTPASTQLPASVELEKVEATGRLSNFFSRALRAKIRARGTVPISETQGLFEVSFTTNHPPLILTIEISNSAIGAVRASTIQP